MYQNWRKQLVHFFFKLCAPKNLMSRAAASEVLLTLCHWKQVVDETAVYGL